MPKRLVAIALAAVLALGLTPMPSQRAHAADLAAGVATQAGTTSVYVITSSTTKSKHVDAESASSYTTKFKYNESGLQSSAAARDFTSKYAYKDGKLVKIDDINTKTIVKYNNAGKAVSSTTTSEDGSTKRKYIYDKKGHLAAYSVTYRGGGVIKYSFAYNKKSLPVKAKIRTRSGDFITTSTYSYAYDKRGNLKTAKIGSASVRSFANAYDKRGLLTEQTRVDNDRSYTTTYTYKKLTVSKAYAAAIKAQQWNLRNPAVTFGGGFVAGVCPDV